MGADSPKAKDRVYGILLLVMGLLITGYAILAAGNGQPFVLWGSGFFLGPVFLLLGGASLYPRRVRDDESDDDPGAS